MALASVGMIFLRDPNRAVGADQLNGGKFFEISSDHWELTRPLLEGNESLFGIPVSRLPAHKGGPTSPEAIFRLLLPAGQEALQPDRAWVKP